MSIFQITSLQSFRSAAKRLDPVAELKVTGHEKRSRTPLFIGASIAALLMYVKTAHAAAAPNMQGSIPNPNDGDSDQAPARDDAAAQAARTLPAHSLQPEGRLPAEGEGDWSDDPVAQSLGQWGWEITGNSSFRMDLGSGASVTMRGYRLLGGSANDNATMRAGRHLSGAMKTSRPKAGSSEPNARPNRAPTVAGPVLLDGGFSAMAVLFTLDDLLKGATDPDNNTLYVVNVEASSGAIIPVDDGYMYIGDSPGAVTLSYDITDGQEIVSQQASFTVTEHAATLGTVQADTIVGGDGGELIETGAGNDTVHAGAAMDTIYSGDGNDEVHGGAGNDLIVGAGGNDKLFGDAGNDLLFGGAGNDEIHGGEGGDRAYGGDGNDMILGDAGNDVLFGEAGADTILDGDGEDYVDGGAGNDTVEAAPDRAADTFDGGAGVDTVSYAASTRAVHVDIANEEAKGADIGTDTVKNFEIFVGGSGDDTFVTDDYSAIFYGGSGNDTYEITMAGIDGAAPVRHVIEDFEVGDKVEMSSYDIFEKADAAPQFLDQMNALANSDAPDSAVPIQFRFDSDTQKTFIEADFDHDDRYEVTVEIDGQHALQLHHHAFV